MNNDPQAILDQIADILMVGKEARKNPNIIIQNIQNAVRRANCLSGVESIFFTDYTFDKNGGFHDHHLRWSDSPDDYVERFGEVLKTKYLKQIKRISDEDKLDLVTNWFSDDWAIRYALNLLDDYDEELLK